MSFMEQLLVSLWFGTLAMSEHIRFSSIKTAAHCKHNRERLFKEWLIANGISRSLATKLFNHGIVNVEMLKCVALQDVEPLSDELKLSRVERIQFKSVLHQSAAAPQANSTGVSGKQSLDHRYAAFKNLDVQESAAIQELTLRTKLIEKVIKMLGHQSKNVDSEMSRIERQIESSFEEIKEEILKRKQNLKKKLTKLGQAEKKRIHQLALGSQQQLVACRKKLDECYDVLQKEQNMEQRTNKVSSIAHSLSEDDVHCGIRHGHNYKFLRYELDTAKVSKCISSAMGDIHHCDDFYPVLLSLQQRRSSNRIHLKWKLHRFGAAAVKKPMMIRRNTTSLISAASALSPSQTARSPSETSMCRKMSDLNLNESRSRDVAITYKLRIECAYLKSEQANAEDVLDSEFIDKVEVNLSQQHLSDLQEQDACTTTIQISKKHSLLIRLAYFDGTAWSNYSNEKFIKLESKLDPSQLKLKFDRTRYGDRLLLNDEKRSVKCTYHDNLYHTCLFGIELNRSLCKVFKIRFRILSFGKYTTHCDFFLGFMATTASNSPRARVPDYNQALGCGNNKSGTLGVRVRANEVWLYDAHNSKTKIHTETRGKYRVNDCFKMVFDFDKRTFAFCCDAQQIVKLKLTANGIIPAITLGNQDEEIQVCSWEFK